jgi:hypothetical protein
MGAAVVHLHWTPSAFWRSTMAEYQSAVDVIEEANEAQERGNVSKR